MLGPSNSWPQQGKEICDNPPRYYRLLQIGALLRALDLMPAPSPPPPGKTLAQSRAFLGKVGRFFRTDKDPAQMEALLGELDRFFRAEFVNLRTSEEGRLIREKLGPHWTHEDYRDGRAVAPRHLQAITARLLAYRGRVHAVTSFNDGVIEASLIFLVSSSFTQEINGEVTRAIEPLDDLLALIIDPTGRTFSRDQLIAQHGFPEVDLSALDDAWY